MSNYVKTRKSNIRRAIATALIAVAMLSLVALPAAAAPAGPDRDTETTTAWSAGWNRIVSHVVTGFWSGVRSLFDQGGVYIDPDGERASDQQRSYEPISGTPRNPVA
jgi:hypothetical protein